MKKKRILSLFLTLTMLISCIASLSIVNVSAHSNQSVATDFENVSKYDFESGKSTSLTADDTPLTAAESVDTTGDSPALVKERVRYSSDDFILEYNSNAFIGQQYVTAPSDAEKYGRVMKYYVMKDWVVGETNYYDNFVKGLTGNANYFTPAVSFTKKFTDSVSLKMSLYMNNGKYRSLRYTGNAPSGTTTVRFNDNGTIEPFPGNGGVAIPNKKWSANHWYDIELKYNMNTEYYELTVYEDGEFFGTVSGTVSKDLYSYINGYNMLYNNTISSTVNSVDMITYMDNFEIKSIPELRPATEQTEISFVDFEGFTGQTAGSNDDFPKSSEGSFSCGYQGNPELSVVHAVEDAYNENWEKAIDLGTSAKLISPIKPAGSAITDARYQYPSLRWTPNAKMPDNYRIIFDARFPIVSTISLMFRSSGDAVFKYDSSKFYIAGNVVSELTPNNNDWYNFDIALDGDTGYYKATITNLTSPTANPAVEVEGCWSNLVSLMDNTDNRMYFQVNGSTTAEQYVYLDNFYFGEYAEALMPFGYEYNFEDGKNPDFVSTTHASDVVVEGKTFTATNADQNAGRGSIDIPNPYGKYTATIRFSVPDFNNARKYISIGACNPIIIFGTTDTATGEMVYSQIHVGGKGYTTPLEANKIYTLVATVPFDKAGTYGDCKLYDTDDITAISSSNLIGNYNRTAVGSNGKDFTKITVNTSYGAIPEGKESSLTIHDVTFSNIQERASLTNTTATGAYVIKSAADSASTTTIGLPYHYANSGYQYQADFTFKDFGSAKTFKFGDATIATVDNEGVLTVGEETMTLAADANVALKLDYNKATGENVAVTFTDGTTSLTATAAPAEKIVIEAAEGASELYLENIKNTTIYTLKNEGGYVFDEFNPADSVNLAFKNVIQTEDIKVYAPKGAINDDVLVEATATKSADGKTITIDFDKEYDTHYHIAYTVTDEFGQTLTDVVELDTAAAPSISEVSIAVEGNVATAAFNNTGKTGEVFFAIALYSGDELVSVVPSNITLSADDSDKDYTVSIEAPADGVTYKVKAFRWNKSNQAPFENAKAPETTIMVPAA
ncbi:MAG: hypothetical protein II998_12240 [Clostridia bacterium]|nr:hypothetical protein [Clostridia bacterium]